MAQFFIYGPAKVPTKRLARGRMIDDCALDDFWEEHATVAEEVGCYAFGMRAGRGITPVYVGQTANSFEAECFSHRNLNIYREPLLSWEKGTPVMFFVVLDTRVNKPAIADVERFLIALAVRKNRDLANVHGTREPSWGIRGVIRGGSGKVSDNVKAFRQMIGL